MSVVNKKYLLKKFPGKGGWTYAEIPEFTQDKSNPFGWVKVKGDIDGYELKGYKLMPMGNGKLFLPVKAEIRKKIGKQAGDYVKVTLHVDESGLEIPVEIMECFKNEPPLAYQNFMSFSEGERKYYLEWINNSKREETKVQRIVEMMNRLIQGKKLYDA